MKTRRGRRKTANIKRGKDHPNYKKNTYASLTPEQKEKHRTAMLKNNYWQIANVLPGRQTRYTAVELWNKFIEYNERMKDHHVGKPVFVGKDGIEKEFKIKAPLSIESFTLFANMAKSTFENYERGKQLSQIDENDPYLADKAKNYKELKICCSLIRQAINADLFEKGAANIYNSNLIMRYIGLTDKQDITTNGEALGSAISKVKIELPNGINLDDIEEAQIVNDNKPDRELKAG